MRNIGMSTAIILFIGLALPLFGLTSSTSFALPAFPGAEGAGALSVGGRGGETIEVTNLNATGDGSFRAALEASGARIVVFRVGGIIDMHGATINIAAPHITVAGQTAPGGGVLIKDARIFIRTHDVTIRYLRFRVETGSIPTESSNPLTVTSGAHEVIIDHCSVSWAQDENFTVWSGSPAAYNITYSWNILAEGIRNHSCGLITGSDSNAEDMTNIDVHHNFFASNINRNPLIKTKTSRIVNNIIYNWDWWGTGIGGGVHVDIINNHWKVGPDLGDDNYEVTWRQYFGDASFGPAGDPSIYITGNTGPNAASPTDDNWQMITTTTGGWETAYTQPDVAFRRNTPLAAQAYPITAANVSDLEALIFDDAGANRSLDENGDSINNRDSVDVRVIADYQNNTGHIPTSHTDAGGFPTIAAGTPYADSDHDGMPDAWELAKGLDPNSPADAKEDKNGNGYMNLEDFLNGVSTLPPRDDGGVANDANPASDMPGDMPTGDMPTGDMPTGDMPGADASDASAPTSDASRVLSNQGCSCETASQPRQGWWVLCLLLIAVRPRGGSR